MPQRQKTEAPKAAELPELTEQQQEFVRQRLAGKTAADAYRAAYSTENMTARTIWAEASRTNTHPGVSAWLVAAREAHLGTAVLTRDSHMAELERIREIALKSGNIGAAVAAETARGKVAGHQVDRVLDLTPTDAVQTLKEIASHGPEAEAYAANLARLHGIEWTPAAGTTRH